MARDGAGLGVPVLRNTLREAAADSQLHAQAISLGHRGDNAPRGQLDDVHRLRRINLDHRFGRCSQRQLTRLELARSQQCRLQRVDLDDDVRQVGHHFLLIGQSIHIFLRGRSGGE